MGRRPNSSHTSIVVHGSSTGSALERVRVAFEPVPEFVLSTPSSDTIQVAHRRGSIYRRTELCTVRAIQEPQHLVVTVSGNLGREAIDIIRAALLAPPPSTVAPVDSFRPSVRDQQRPAFRPPADWFIGADQDDGTPTVAEVRDSPTSLLPPPPADRPSVDATVVRTGDALPSPPAPPRTVMVRAAGLEPRALTTVLLLGRDPQPRPNDVVETQFLRVADSAMSKTHVAIGPSPDGVWVQDRNSSNGTEAILPSGPRPLEPDVPTVLSLPCAVRAGDTTIEIAWGAG